MPEFILPAEADRCPHCNDVLRWPPTCCMAAIREYDAEAERHADSRATAMMAPLVEQLNRIKREARAEINRKE